MDVSQHAKPNHPTTNHAQVCSHFASFLFSLFGHEAEYEIMHDRNSISTHDAHDDDTADAGTHTDSVSNFSSDTFILSAENMLTRLIFKN